MQAELQSIGRGIAAILQENFVGFYITGSFTMGAWNPQKSDLDFLVVVKHPANSDEDAALEQLHTGAITTFCRTSFRSKGHHGLWPLIKARLNELSQLVYRLFHQCMIGSLHCWQRNENPFLYSIHNRKRANWQGSGSEYTFEMHLDILALLSSFAQFD